MRTISMSPIREAIMQAKERNRLVADLIAQAQAIDTVNSEEDIDALHDAAQAVLDNQPYLHEVAKYECDF